MNKIKRMFMYLRGNRGYKPQEVEDAWTRFVIHRIYGLGQNYIGYAGDRQLLNSYYSPPKKENL